jgi:hypothetical protein
MTGTSRLFVSAWAREARMAGRWRARLDAAPEWARRICRNHAEECEANARGLTWLSVFG